MLSRRRLMTGAGGVAFLGASAAVLPLFSTPDRHQDPSKCVAPDTSAKDKTFVISNWPEYIDSDGYVTKHSKSTLHQFEDQFGVKVDYTADVNDNVEFFAKVVNQLGACAPTKRDMFVLTDWMAARMINMGWIQQMDPAKVPNLHANIISSLRAPDWDPKRQYSAPWQSGFTGIGYNKKYLPNPPKTINELLTRPDLKGKVAVLTEMRDTMGLIMLGNGIDPDKFTQAEWDKALGILQDAKDRGQIRAFQGNEYLDDLSAGNTYACMAWSGDVAAADDENLAYLVPEEGQMIWADNMLIPNLASHKTIAEEWVNWYYDPVIAAQLANYNWYISPCAGARDVFTSGKVPGLDPSLADNPLIFPDDDYLKQTHLFMALEEYQIRDYEGDFADVSGT